ncbi:MAG: tRNA pseudouridine(55) synthase TruB [Acidimicrobiaceae bacterium]|nr:tRNA pseudouridine(55) synthase TruB [Acidimicrobiaceae bacterium]MDE0607733.1 tRNA pseudouridine(55) synthase TruB [Acidimicrobiaceae bacterium]
MIDKPAGWTSHDVVAKCRGVLGTRKIGHSGTLDPAATGVLVLGVGKATRLLRFLTELPKSYVGEIVLGVETSTLDADGEVIATHDMSAVADDQVRSAALSFVGPIMQVPPMVSAVKVGGKRLYELAREGKEIERRPRAVEVHRCELAPVAGESGVWRCEVECSSGTYIRSLAADLGASLGGGAHLRSLRRVAVGGFTIDEATSLDSPVLRPLIDAVGHLDTRVVSDEAAVRVGYGQMLEPKALMVAEHDEGPWAVVNPAGELLAVYGPSRGLAKPIVVISDTVASRTR